MNVARFPATSALICAAVLSACSANKQSTSSNDAITVSSTKDACTLSASSAPSGTVRFDVRNDGSAVTEFYLFGADGVRVAAEVENIGPGITRRLVFHAVPGTYVAACKPGMTGKGIRAPFTVTDSGTHRSPTGEYAEQLKAATDRYGAFIKSETADLLTGTKAFAQAFVSGDDDKARSIYAPTRMHWERIEPVAESFGDIDPKLDLREADLEAGQEWTGWHRAEKELWPPSEGYTAMTATERASIADRLVSDTADLLRRLDTLTYRPDQLSNGAKELLDEVAVGKVTGEEEIWSRTDLWDFQANVEGARFAFEVLEPVVAAKDKSLAEELAQRFAAVQTALDRHRSGDGFALYRDLSTAEVKVLADVVNAISEPLSRLTATVVG